MASRNTSKKSKDQELSDLQECPSIDEIENYLQECASESFTRVTDEPKSQKQQQTLPQQLPQRLPQQQLKQSQQQSSPPVQHRKEAIPNTPDDYLNINSKKDKISDTNGSSGQEIRKQKNQDAISQSRCNLEFEAASSSAFDSNESGYPNLNREKSSVSNVDSRMLMTPMDILSHEVSLLRQKNSIDKGKRKNLSGKFYQNAKSTRT